MIDFNIYKTCMIKNNKIDDSSENLQEKYNKINNLINEYNEHMSKKDMYNENDNIDEWNEKYNKIYEKYKEYLKNDLDNYIPLHERYPNNENFEKSKNFEKYGSIFDESIQTFYSDHT